MKKTMDKLTYRNQKAHAWRKLVDLRNEILLNQIDTLEFIKRLELILYNDVPQSSIKMAGNSGAANYTTIAQRLLKDELGKTNSLENLKIDITYHYEHFVRFLDLWEVKLPNHKW